MVVQCHVGSLGHTCMDTNDCATGARCEFLPDAGLSEPGHCTPAPTY
jgi:hypothetical protein